MPSFDIVSKVDMQEVDNAVNQTCKEVDQRYDFKGTSNEITLNKDSITILAADDYKLQAIVDILKGKLTRRQVSAKCMDFGKVENASGLSVRQNINLVQGISKEKAKEIIKLIKDTKLKVQPQINDDEVRVSAKKIDDLQNVMQLLKGADVGVELQFVNMRS